MTSLTSYTNFDLDWGRLNPHNLRRDWLWNFPITNVEDMLNIIFLIRHIFAIWLENWDTMTLFVWMNLLDTPRPLACMVEFVRVVNVGAFWELSILWYHFAGFRPWWSILLWILVINFTLDHGGRFCLGQERMILRCAGMSFGNSLYMWYLRGTWTLG